MQVNLTACLVPTYNLMCPHEGMMGQGNRENFSTQERHLGKNITCPDCKGTGMKETTETCENCNGSGQVEIIDDAG